MTTGDANAAGVYLPDNPRLRDVLIRADGPGFRLDHARLLLHFICTKRWTGDVDKDGFARLNAGILRRWIQPRAFGSLKRYLLAHGVLKTAGHSAGRHATGYRIAEAFDGPPRRFEVEYDPLAEKLCTWRAAHKAASYDPELKAVMDRRRPVLDHLRSSLNALFLPASPQAMVNTLRGQVNSDHVAYVTQCIQHHDHDGLNVDRFGWRVHNLITRTSSRLRRTLMLDGAPVAEVDIAGSQPLLLAMLLRCAPRGNSAQHRERMHNIMEGALPRGLSPFLCSVAEPEKNSFLAICQAGELYDLLACDVGVERDRAKRQLFRDVLFGKPHISGPLTEAFGRRWPSLLWAIRQAKRRHGYKAVAQALQRLESFLVLDCICPRLLEELPHLPFLTVHDSALIVAGAAEDVAAAICDEFLRWGVRPTIRIKETGG